MDKDEILNTFHWHRWVATQKGSVTISSEDMDLYCVLINALIKEQADLSAILVARAEELSRLTEENEKLNFEIANSVVAKPTKQKDIYITQIKELTEENERLRKYEITYNTPWGKQTIPNLLSLDGDVAECYKRIEDKITANTVRKMQERLKAEKFTHKNFGELVYVEDIDQIVKELLEDVK